MDALLTALVACFIGELGDRSQRLTLILADRFRRTGAIVVGVAVAAIANAVISAAAGSLIAPMLGSDARALFLAMAIVAAGFGLIAPVRAPDPLIGWKIGALPTSALGVFILGFGNGPQFLAMGIATGSGAPMMAGVGTALGTMIALVPAAILGGDHLRGLPVAWMRRISGVLLLIVGSRIGLGALGLA